MKHQKDLNYLIENTPIGRTGLTIKQIMDRDKAKEQPELTEDLVNQILEAE